MTDLEKAIDILWRAIANIRVDNKNWAWCDIDEDDNDFMNKLLSPPITKQDLIEAVHLATKKSNEMQRELESRAKVKQFLLAYQDTLRAIAANNGRSSCKNCGMSNEEIREVIKYFNK